MKFFFKFLIIFYTIFTSNLYSSTSEIPNEKVFDNPKKEVTTVEAKKNKEHAEMNIVVNKLNIQEIQGHDIGNGKTQYFIPKEEKENKLLRSLINNKDNQYLIFETKEQLSEYLNKNKKAKKKRDDANSIQYEVMQDENQTMLTVNSDKEVYILDNKNNVYFGTPLNIETRATDFAAQVKFLFDRAFMERFLNINGKTPLSKLYELASGNNTAGYIFANGVVEYGTNRDAYLSNGYGYNYVAIKKGSSQPLRYTLGNSKNLITEEVWDGLEYVSGNISPLNEISVVLNKKQDWKTVGRKDVLEKTKVNFYEIARAGFVDITTALYMRWSGAGSLKSGHKLEFTVKDFDFTQDPWNVHTEYDIYYLPVGKGFYNFNQSDVDNHGFYGMELISYKYGNLSRNEMPGLPDGNSFQNSVSGAGNVFNILTSDTRMTERVTLNSNLIELNKGIYESYTFPDIKLKRRVEENTTVIGYYYMRFPWKEYRGRKLTFNIYKSEYDFNMLKIWPNLNYTLDLATGIAKSELYISNPHKYDKRLHVIDIEAPIIIPKSKLKNLKKKNNFSGIDIFNITDSQLTFCITGKVVPEKDNNILLYFSPYSNQYDEKRLKINFKNIMNNTPQTDGRYEIKRDPRFYKAMDILNERNQYFNGYINGKDYSKLDNITSSGNLRRFVSIVGYPKYSMAEFDGNVFKFMSLRNEVIFKNNGNFLDGYIVRNGSERDEDDILIAYLTENEGFKELHISVDKLEGNINEYNGTGNIDLRTAKKDKPYTFTQNNLSNNEGLTLNNSGEFITTGTAFNANSDIVNRIIVNDNTTSHITGKVYNDGDIKLELGENNLTLTKLREFVNEKTLTINYYYNDLHIGTYVLTVTCQPKVTLEGIDSFDFGTLIPGSSQTLNGQFTISSPSKIVSKVEIPTSVDMTKEGGHDKIPLTITSSTQREGNNVKGSVSVTANVPKEATAGTYNGTIDLIVTIE